MQVTSNPQQVSLCANVHGLVLANPPGANTSASGSGATLPNGATASTSLSQPSVHHGALTQNYFKKQVSSLMAQAAQVQLMLQQLPSEGPAKELADIRADIANDTKALATAPDAPGDEIMYD